MGYRKSEMILKIGRQMELWAATELENGRPGRHQMQGEGNSMIRRAMNRMRDDNNKNEKLSLKT